MKFSSYLVSIAGVEIYPMISLLIFVVFFILLILWVFRMSREEITLLENMPLSDGCPSHTINKNEQ